LGGGERDTEISSRGRSNSKSTDRKGKWAVGGGGGSNPSERDHLTKGKRNKS